MENKDSLEELVRSIARDKDAKREKAEQQESRMQKAVSDDASRQKAEKMEKIRAALKTSDGEKPAPAAEKPEKPLKPLKPLRRSETEKKEIENAAAETVYVNAEEAKRIVEGSAPEAAKKPAAKKPAGQSNSAPKKSAGKPAERSAAPRAAAAKTEEPKKKPAKKVVRKNQRVFGPPALAEQGITYAMLAGVTGIALAISAVASYFIVAHTYKDKFLPNTLVNATEVGRMSLEEAEDTLVKNTEVKNLTLITHDGEQVEIPAKDFGVQYSVPYGALDEALSENEYSWVGKLFNGTEYKVNFDLSYDEEALRQLINDHDWGDDISQDACIVHKDDGSFTIQEETLGDEFDTEVLLSYIREKMTSGMSTLEMEDSGCYEMYRASVRYEDLTGVLDLYNSFGRCNITFDFDDRKKVVTSDMIVDWLMTYADGTVLTDSTGTPQFDRSKVAEFVAQMAADTDTYGKPRHFYATLDGWIDVPWDGDLSSSYGWQIDQEETTLQLIDLMQKGETVTVEPVYANTGYTRKTDDIGNTYVEADISAQHFWVYINGQMVLDDDFVSGTETDPDRRTPRGVCCILGKVYQTVLGTYANQGYECPVDYWMPFNWLGCGFHDLSRGAYGGSIYMYNGSHGCLNLSYSTAQQLFEIVEEGMPVLVHD